MIDSVYSIGHSNHSIEEFVALLTSHGVTAVADVRSQPYSRYNPQFNRESLQSALTTAGISYVFLGRELGARSEVESCYVDGKAQYDRIARTKLFRDGIERISQGIRTHRVALMCAEKDPLTCHRAILICRHLVDQGIGARHILADGTIESHDAAMSRLMSELGMEEIDLFRTHDELIIDAYEQRGSQIAYRQKNTVEEPTGSLDG